MIPRSARLPRTRNGYVLLKRSSLVLVGATALAVGVAACGVGGGEDRSSRSGTTSTGGADATPGCTTDADCAASVPRTSPASCAAGKCDTLRGVCEYVARDEDGDGHAAADCKSSSGVAIQLGDDCNDHDPGLYPGRARACSTTEDGGTPEGTLCLSGRVTCLPDGTESPCTGTVACANGCVGGVCTECSPGQTRCALGGGLQTCTSSGAWGAEVSCGAIATCTSSGGAAQCAGECAAGSTVCSGTMAVQTCTPGGTWADPVACVNQTCVNGSCAGSCAPGQTACSGNGVATCTSGGWSVPVECVGQTCVGSSAGAVDGGTMQADGGTSVAASCEGVCVQGATRCSGPQPQICDPGGQWQDIGTACADLAPVCTNGTCVTCTPGDFRCNAAQPQQCDTAGAVWRNVGLACTGTTPACLDGACVACAPGALGCSGQQPQQCDSSGTWQTSGAACADQACVSGACTGSCSPGTTECASNTQLQVCGADGQWGAAATCTNACLGGTDVVGGTCGGDCVPGAPCGASCTEGVQTAASTCDSSGSCPGGGSKTPCDPYTCGPTACGTSCATHVDCTSGNFCWLSACVRAEAVACGYSHTCAVTTSGALQCWGYNYYGELGNSSTTGSNVPVAVAGLSSGVTAVSAGQYHTCALTTAGGVMCWGYNYDGELGNQSTGYADAPVAVMGLSSGVIAVSAGEYHTCALTTAGGVMCWGYNAYGQLGNSSTTESTVPVAVTGLSSGVIAVSTGQYHTCALTTAGGVMCWGYNYEGQLGNSSTTESTVPVAVTGLSSGVTAVSAGGYHTCALTTAGGVMCWGYNNDGQLGNSSTTGSNVPVAATGLSSGIAAISVNGYSTCGLTSAGGLLCWGNNGNGQVGVNSVTGYISAPLGVVEP